MTKLRNKSHTTENDDPKSPPASVKAAAAVAAAKATVTAARTAAAATTSEITATNLAQEGQARAKVSERKARAALKRAERDRAVAETAKLIAEDKVTTLDAAVSRRDHTFAYAVHDLRTPLTALLGHFQLQQRRINRGLVPSASQLEEWMSLSSNLLNRELAIVAEVSEAAARPIQEERPLQREEIDVNRLAYEAAQAVSGGHSDRIKIHEATNLKSLRGDRVQLSRVLENIIGNALKFSSVESEVTLSIECKPDLCTITVEDSGVGVPSADLDQLFIPYFRSSTAAAIPGTGLGLSGAQVIVQQHGGAISIHSEAGKGTTVTVTLPLLAPPPTDESPLE